VFCFDAPNIWLFCATVQSGAFQNFVLGEGKARTICFSTWQAEKRPKKEEKAIRQSKNLEISYILSIFAFEAKFRFIFSVIPCF
jgi:hypothetical protein